MRYHPLWSNSGGLPPAAQQFNCLLSTVVYTTPFLVRMGDQKLVSPGESQPGGLNNFVWQFYYICIKAWTWYGASALPLKVLITSKPWLWLMASEWTNNQWSVRFFYTAQKTHKTASWDPQARLPPSRRPNAQQFKNFGAMYHWRDFPKAKKNVFYFVAKS